MKITDSYMYTETLLNYFKKHFEPYDARRLKQIDVIRELADLCLEDNTDIEKLASEMRHKKLIFNYFTALENRTYYSRVIPEDIFDKWYKLNQDEFISIKK